jgi:hypothetical protein
MAWIHANANGRAPALSVPGLPTPGTVPGNVGRWRPMRRHATPCRQPGNWAASISSVRFVLLGRFSRIAGALKASPTRPQQRQEQRLPVPA